METITKFDKEYSTQWLKEVDYLDNKGIKYTFDKYINGVKTYKYTKTKKLFQALAEFHD